MANKDKKEISDHDLQEVVLKCMEIMPEHMTALGIMKVSRTIEREYFRVYLRAFPAHIDKVIATESEQLALFLEELKQIAADNVGLYQKGGR